MLGLDYDGVLHLDLPVVRSQPLTAHHDPLRMIEAVESSEVPIVCLSRPSTPT